MIDRKRCLELAEEVEKSARNAISSNADEDYVANMDITRALRDYANSLPDIPEGHESSIEQINHLSVEELARYINCLGQNGVDITPGDRMDALPSKLIAYEAAYRLKIMRSIITTIGHQRDMAELNLLSVQAELTKLKKEMGKDEEGV